MARTLYRKASGIKLYAEHESTGESADNQTAKSSRGLDMNRSSAAQRVGKQTGRGKKATKQKVTATKKAAGKASKKPSARRTAGKKK